MERGLKSKIHVTGRDHGCIYTKGGLDGNKNPVPKWVLIFLGEVGEKIKDPQAWDLHPFMGMTLSFWCLLRADQGPWLLEGHGYAEDQRIFPLTSWPSRLS